MFEAREAAQWVKAVAVQACWSVLESRNPHIKWEKRETDNSTQLSSDLRKYAMIGVH